MSSRLRRVQLSSLAIIMAGVLGMYATPAMAGEEPPEIPGQECSFLDPTGGQCALSLLTFCENQGCEASSATCKWVDNNGQTERWIFCHQQFE